MAIPTKSVRGINAVYQAAITLCRLGGIFRPALVTVFTSGELAAFDAMCAAAQAFASLIPYGG